MWSWSSCSGKRERKIAISSHAIHTFCLVHSWQQGRIHDYPCHKWLGGAMTCSFGEGCASLPTCPWWYCNHALLVALHELPQVLPSQDLFALGWSFCSLWQIFFPFRWNFSGVNFVSKINKANKVVALPWLKKTFKSSSISSSLPSSFSSSFSVLLLGVLFSWFLIQVALNFHDSDFFSWTRKK